jgi:chaperone modulatory protein CbpM
MTMHDDEILAGTILDESALTVHDLACVCSVSTEWIVRHVEEGSFSVAGRESTQWRFSSRDVGRARRILQIERDFDAVPELAALVADMLDELDTLRARLRRAGIAG